MSEVVRRGTCEFDSARVSAYRSTRLTNLDTREIGEEIRIDLSYLRNQGYLDTVVQLETLVGFWVRSHDKIYSDQHTRSGFIDSFNKVKYHTTRNEFATMYPAPNSPQIFDAIDSMFKRLTYRNGASVDYYLMLADIVRKTDMFRSLAQTSNKINALMKLALKTKDPVRFYLLCFSFLLAMEGYYDELLRLIYAIERVTSGQVLPDAHRLQFMAIEDIEKSLGPPPREIVGIWNIGHGIRNAIAHARFYYDDKTNTMRFVNIDPSDGRIKMDRHFAFDELRNLLNSISVVGGALIVLLNLLTVFTLLVAPSDMISKA